MGHIEGESGVLERFAASGGFLLPGLAQRRVKPTTELVLLQKVYKFLLNKNCVVSDFGLARCSAKKLCC